MNYEFIDTDSALNEFCAHISTQPWICVDTEFLRTNTYYPKLCLIQVSSSERAAIIDPLAVDNLDALREPMLDTGIVKVMHSGEQDLEIFFQLWEAVPTPLFDTQVAAAFLGYGHQVGYGKLVEQLLGKAIDKSSSRNDWSRRPLSQKELDYAAGDVIWLREIYALLQTALADKNRLDWLQDDFKRLENPNRYTPNPQNAWKKVKGLRRLKPVQKQRGARIAAWRETKAMEMNIPRGRVLHDSVVLDLSKRQLDSLDELGRLQGISEGQVKRFGKNILKALNNDENFEIAEDVRPTPLSLEQKTAVNILAAAATYYAEKANISEENLGGRREIEKLIRGDDSSSFLSGWRYDSVGKYLQDILSGDSVISLNQQGAEFS